ncbi:hypothetical protein [Flavobacterium sp. '19STA2R22 D10 B1']|uniref:hypothetical protein n=1 Tax=Flavobacterium aerium TaxID=3037261 RepID=UPI00278BD180|nr:hypothetical protein [Flavobacterium sp. '19STA2R22 D10 B1']
MEIFTGVTLLGLNYYNIGFDLQSNSCNIDTGAYYGYGLTGLKIVFTGELLEIITIPMHSKDIQ